jgi:hypothetical protein
MNEKIKKSSKNHINSLINILRLSREKSEKNVYNNLIASIIA